MKVVNFSKVDREHPVSGSLAPNPEPLTPIRTARVAQDGRVREGDSVLAVGGRSVLAMLEDQVLALVLRPPSSPCPFLCTFHVV